MCDMLTTVICSGAVGALIVCGILLSFKILKFPDLTSDGSYAIGCISYCFMVVSGFNPILCLVASTAIGMICGLTTALLSYSLKIPNVICGLVTLVATMGLVQKFPIIQYSKVADLQFSKMAIVNIAFVLIVTVPIIYAIYQLMVSEFGLRFRAFSESKAFSDSFAINKRLALITGLVISNGMVALAGALSNQIMCMPTAYSGIGTFLFAISAILIGERFFPISNNSHCINFIVIIAISSIYRITLMLSSYMVNSSIDSSFICIFISLIVVFIYSVITNRCRDKYQCKSNVCKSN